VRVAHGSCDSDDKLDRAILLLGTADHMPLLSSLPDRFVNAVKLQKLAVALAHFLFDVPLPQIGCKTERPIRLFVQGNVIRSFKLNHEIAFDLILVIAPGFGVLEQGQAQFVARGAQGSDVFDLRFDSGEMTHLFRLRVEGYALKKGGESHAEIATPLLTDDEAAINCALIGFPFRPFG